jgi:Immunoglobulin domain
MIWVPNQLVGAPAGTDVTIECHTEAYPRAISYWVYDSVMLLSTKKYVTSTTENSYRTHMKLTIRHLRDKDFGNYRCIAKNSLGETEGSIRLYGEWHEECFILSFHVQCYDANGLTICFNWFMCECLKFIFLYHKKIKTYVIFENIDTHIS